MIKSASTVATYGGSALAFCAGISANEFAALGGLVVAAAGLVINTAISIWYKSRMIRVAELEAARVRSGGGDV